jgi:predicted Zn-dependent protease
MAAAPIAIFANVIRIVVTGVLRNYVSTAEAREAIHDWAGIITIPFAVIVFMLILLLLGRVFTRLQEPGGVAWLTKWGLALILVFAGLVTWGRIQGKRAITTLRETAARHESQQNWPLAMQYLHRYLRAMPDDHAAFVHLAEIYRAHAASPVQRARATDILQTAWQRQPDREDLAISAIQSALSQQKFDEAVTLSDRLLAKAKQPQTQAAATKLRATALVQSLKSQESASRYSWDTAKEALERALQLPDYETAHAQMLAEAYRGYLSTPAPDERRKLADELMDRVVKDRPEDPLSWLIRYQYRMRFNNQPSAASTNADQDLDQALELAIKQPLNASGTQVFLAAASRAGVRGDTKQQADLLEQACQRSPLDFRPYIALATVKAKSNDAAGREQAINVLREAVARCGASDQLLIPLATLLVENGQTDEAERVIAPLEKVLAQVSGPARGTTKLRVGIVRSQIIRARQGAQAAAKHLRDLLNDAEVRQATAQAPQILAGGYAHLANLYVSLGTIDLARDALQQATRFDPANKELRIHAAHIARQMGDFDAADRDYQAMAQAGASADAQLELVEVEIQRQLQQSPPDRNWQQAKGMLNRASRAGAPANKVRLLAAEILSATDEPAKAEQTIAQITKDFPQDAAAWRALAIFRQRHNNTAGALEAAGKLAEISDQLIDAATLRATILSDAGRTDEAIDHLRKTAADAPADEQPRAAIALAQLLNQLGRAPEAIVALEIAHENAPQNLQIVDMLANYAWMLQDWPQLEKYEGWLHTAEGDDGTIWKAYRAQRLLAGTRSSDDPQFQEAAKLVSAIERERPRWSKAHFLAGEIAYRANRTEAAAAAFERAWQYGGRGILLADRLIDVSTQLGRFDEARRYAGHVRDYVSASQGLFDRAAPYLIDENDSRQMEQLARQWVEQNPNDPNAHSRLGRVLLVLAQSSPAAGKKDLESQAESEFRRSIQLAPNDVRPWVSAILLFANSSVSRDRALAMAQELASQENIDKLQRDFALAQLYEQLNAPMQANHFYQQSIAAAESHSNASMAAEVFRRAAQFYVAKVPSLAETYARRALALDPKNSDAQLALVYLLSHRTDGGSVQEALNLLDSRASNGDSPLEPRLRAALLAQRGQPQDLDSAIDILKRFGSLAREDKLLLARLYERTGQIPPAWELLEQLVRVPAAPAGDLTEYVRFWQEHFLSTASGDSEAQFARQAKEVYRRLGTLPGQMPERLRWQIRELKARNANRDVSGTDALAILSDVQSEPAFKQIFQQMLTVLLQEKCEQAAISLATNPPKPVSNTEAAIGLCVGYVVVPAAENVETSRRDALNNFRSTHEKNDDVIQAIGDASFMAGHYEQAASDYERVLKLQPDHPMARNNLALALGELPGKLPDAQKLVADGLATNATNLDLLDTQAMLEVLAKRPQEAVTTLEKIAEQKSDSPILRLHLAIACDEANSTELAKEHLITAVALGAEQQILSPRDRKSLGSLQARYLVPRNDAKETSLPDKLTDAANGAN